MFRGCSSVTELFDLDRLDTSNVENTSYMFLNCLTLKAVSILGWEASGITDVDQMLSGCSTYILATEEQREFLNKITGSTQHGILDLQPFLAQIKMPVVSRNPPGTF